MTTARLSATSKLGELSWSLQALDTCPGSRGADGELVAACQGCYATTGRYRMPSVKAPREANRELWQEPTWVGDMVHALASRKYFRWFDSGDMYSLALAEKMYSVMAQTPHVQHWLPTRMYKFPKFAAVLDRMHALPNVSVRCSSDSVTGEFTPGVHGSTILPADSPVPEGVTECRAAHQGGQCLDCRACYYRDAAVIGYRAHGARMFKVIQLRRVA